MVSTKECPSCGSPNDLMFTNCVFCKTSLPVIDNDSISNDDLVMLTSDWVSKSSEGLLVVESPQKNEWTGKGIVRMQPGQVWGNAEKYLNLLFVRSISNPILSNLYVDLKSKFEQNKIISKKNSPVKWGLKFIGSIFLILLPLLYFLSKSESDDIDRCQSKIDDIEIKIDKAFQEQNYDYALILVDQLVWDCGLRLNENKLKSESYEKKRDNLKETIYKLKDK
jgi:hypothetical protein